MIASIGIALAAGSASALMFASVLGARTSLLLACLVSLAPLPLMLAGLAWGQLTATIGAIVAACLFGAIFGLPGCIVFIVGVALPAWWLSHLAMLGRPTTGPASQGEDRLDVEWYPVGRILIWIAAIAILTTAGLLLSLGTDIETIGGTLRAGLLAASQNDGRLTADDIELFVKLFVIMAPVALPFGIMMTLMLNLWLAAKVALTSGHLRRPWPDFRSIALPAMSLVVLSVAIAFSFVGGLFAKMALTVATALLLAYAMVGFAALHVLTLSARNRAFWLGCVYIVTFMFSGLIVVMALLGIADALFGLRQRFLQSRPPPLPVS
ncbi:DUF2232 domain-containing protein [Bradyrhizobium sp. WSM 1704]|uniref:DUF2232 domain-containing protein n=1 Tax=Bradyrhizobium semiaridum TaxID=2821404 RepID=UPI001CE34A7D|nr:DUF2232 domain-containing protein [Bradyrhizobium semiaridum]MCA6123747.1 DUF2232 domain-containing protein [Bradyrhizobium semiaridum]